MPTAASREVLQLLLKRPSGFSLERLAIENGWDSVGETDMWSVLKQVAYQHGWTGQRPIVDPAFLNALCKAWLEKK